MKGVAIGVVHPSTVHYEWHRSVLRTLHKLAGEFKFTLIEVASGVNVSRARNKVLKDFVEDTDFEWLLWTDADNAWEPEQLPQLMAHDLPIVGGFYWGWGRGPNSNEKFPVYVNANVTEEDGKKQYEFIVPDLEPGMGVHPVLACGFGFTLVKREVVEAFEGDISLLYPIQEIGNKDGRELGEDTVFGMRCLENGFQSYLDTDCKVRHYKTVPL